MHFILDQKLLRTSWIKQSQWTTYEYYSFQFQTQIISRKFSFSHSYWPSNYPRPNPPERRVQSPVICLLSHTITPFDKTTVTRLVFNEYCAPKFTALKTETKRPKSKVWMLKLQDQRPEPEARSQKPEARRLKAEAQRTKMCLKYVLFYKNPCRNGKSFKRIHGRFDMICIA